MASNCTVCGKDLFYEGEWKMVRGKLLRPLCPNCNGLCASNPDRIATDYPWLFDPSIPKPTSPPISGHHSQMTHEGSSASQRIDEQIKAVNGDYLVIPFIGKIKSGFFSSENAETVSRQLQSLINQYSQRGWEFHTIAKVDIEVAPGCLASLFGAQTSYITFDQVVFRRSRP
jgi:hypothetical protein